MSKVMVLASVLLMGCSSQPTSVHAPPAPTASPRADAVRPKQTRLAALCSTTGHATIRKTDQVVEIEGTPTPILEVAGGEGIEDRLLLRWAVDLNGDGADEIAVAERSGSNAGTVTAVYANCGDEVYVPVFGPDYAWDIQPAARDSEAQSGDAWLMLRIEYATEIRDKRGEWRDWSETTNLTFDGQRYRCDCKRYR